SARLTTLAAEAGVADAIRFLPSASSDEMARLAAQHDIGLASELGTPPNRAISLTNKIFVYLLAGIPVLMSDTPSQPELAGDMGATHRMVNLMDPRSIVAVLCSLAHDPEALAVAKRTASRLGHIRFNWNIEKERFLQAIQAAMG